MDRVGRRHPEGPAVARRAQRPDLDRGLRLRRPMPARHRRCHVAQLGHRPTRRAIPDRLRPLTTGNRSSRHRPQQARLRASGWATRANPTTKVGPCRWPSVPPAGCSVGRWARVWMDARLHPPSQATHAAATTTPPRPVGQQGRAGRPAVPGCHDRSATAHTWRSSLRNVPAVRRLAGRDGQAWPRPPERLWPRPSTRSHIPSGFTTVGSRNARSRHSAGSPRLVRVPRSRATAAHGRKLGGSAGRRRTPLRLVTVCGHRSPVGRLGW